MIDFVSWPKGFHVEVRKLTDYLLNPASDDGASKGRYLASYGFDTDLVHRLAGALLRHADLSNFAGIKVTPYGLKFMFDGSMPAPNGQDATVLTVWQVDAGGDGTARFITTRPSRRRRAP
ncbi:DUF6883 domain-containing protein [Methylobacterium sp. NPDC080182]|uniref:DUF6883 domain-containing protein n=1 Tax=Methylobacterium sp. NPDC080182 TaxID=3390590 RepID=UPI003D06E060